MEIQIPDVVADLLLNVESFLRDKGPDTKAFHHRYRRVGLQESSPQNNFRRIIAALISAGEFCNHNVNYLPEHTSQVPLEFALGLLNSKLGDWYFRLGSTNAAVSHYQLYNLPCPFFAPKVGPKEAMTQEACEKARRVAIVDWCSRIVRWRSDYQLSNAGYFYSVDSYRWPEGNYGTNIPGSK